MKNSWNQTLKNNIFMLRLIYKACPFIIIVSLLNTLFIAIQGFLLNVYLYQYALNALQEGKKLNEILMIITLLASFSIACVVYGCWANKYIEVNSPKVSAYIQHLIQKKAISVELGCYENPDFYDTYVKAADEADNRAFSVLNNFCDVIWVVINILSIGTLIVIIDPIFLFIAFIPLLYSLLFGRKRNKLNYNINMQKKEAERKKDYVRRAFCLKDYSKEMRLTEMWRVMIKQMHDSIVELKTIVEDYGYTMMWFSYLFDFCLEIVVYSGSIIITAYKTLVQKNMLLGDGYVIINSISNIARTINYAGNVFLKLDDNSLYINNLRLFLDYEVQIKEDMNAPVVPEMQTLDICNVGFSYNDHDSATLNNVNLTIQKGEKIAIVGYNGAGKSTLVKLLLRFYDPSEGEILLNGNDIKRYKLSSYRGLFGTIFQDFCLFAVEVSENVMLRGHLTDDDNAVVEKALESSGALEKINSLSNGIHSIVTKEFDIDGTVFSGGEAQKIALSRIFACEQEIVILDEPTAALDPIAEQELYNNIFEACKNKTVIFISHRLSSAAMADRIYFFENGWIKEQGTHAELLATNGRYADMWRKQAEGYSQNDSY